MKNLDVAKAWSVGKKAHTEHFSTDGINIWSYSLMIGTTDIDGNKLVCLYNSNGQFVSKTTSCHVGMALRFSDKTILPNS